MKRALPANAKVAKDAKETVQECVSEFISFITSECVVATRTRGAGRAVSRLGALAPSPTPSPSSWSVSA